MSYNVLIVDDSNIVRKVLIKTFGMTDIKVGQFLEAENGQVALKLLASNWIDIVFLDINMPVMNGMEFMREIRSSNDHAGLPVIIVSTEGSKERREELLQLGISAYLRKPVTPEALVENLTQVFGRLNHE